MLDWLGDHWLLVLALFASLFCVGGYSGWQGAHSDEALLNVALRSAVVIPDGRQDLLILVQCSPAPAYLQRISDLSYEARPKLSRVAAIERAALIVAATGKRVGTSSAVTAGVIGGGGMATRFGAQLAQMRSAAFAAADTRLEKAGKFAVLIAAASGGYFLGEHLLSGLPACDNSSVLAVLEREQNRKRLQMQLFQQNAGEVRELLSPGITTVVPCALAASGTSGSSLNIVQCQAAQAFMQERMLVHVPPLVRFRSSVSGLRDFVELRALCARLSRARARPVCASFVI